MSDVTDVPLLIECPLLENYDRAIVIGTGEGSFVPLPSGAQANSYWFVVVQSSDLAVVANVVSTSNDTVPADVEKFAGSDDHILLVATWALQLNNVPTGDLYTFLKNTGAGAEMDRLDQVYEQLGTGDFGAACYALAATLNDQDSPGIEASSLFNGLVLTAQFMPVEVDGVTTYTPVQLQS